jgi:hypothetical protein
MTNDHVRDAEKYFNRTVQEWHTRLPKHFAAIDVDLAGYCQPCGQWLYIIEAAETQAKTTAQVELLARQTGAVALLVCHDGEQITRARRVWPRPLSPWMDEETLGGYLRLVRASHAAVAHGEVSA